MSMTYQGANLTRFVFRTNVTTFRNFAVYKKTNKLFGNSGERFYAASLFLFVYISSFLKHFTAPRCENGRHGF